MRAIFFIFFAWTSAAALASAARLASSASRWSRSSLSSDRSAPLRMAGSLPQWWHSRSPSRFTAPQAHNHRSRSRLV